MDLQAHISRATNRAAILSNLAEKAGGAKAPSKVRVVTSGGSSSSSSSSSSSLPAAISASSDGRGAQSTLDKLYNFLGLSQSAADSKVRRGISDQLENKSIVLDNTRAQLDAAKSATRLKRNLSRETQTSRRFLKKHKLDHPTSAADGRGNNAAVPPLPLALLQELNAQWRDMVASVAKQCVNLPQLQARLHACTLVGSLVTVQPLEAAATARSGILSGLGEEGGGAAGVMGAKGQSLFDEPYGCFAGSAGGTVGAGGPGCALETTPAPAPAPASEAKAKARIKKGAKRARQAAPYTGYVTHETARCLSLIPVAGGGVGGLQRPRQCLRAVCMVTVHTGLTVSDVPFFFSGAVLGGSRTGAGAAVTGVSSGTAPLLCVLYGSSSLPFVKTADS